MSLFPLVLLLVALAACDTTQRFPSATADGLSLTTDRAAYAPGDEVGLTLHNDRSEAVTTGVLECASLERRDEAGWVRDPALNDRACIAIAVTVEPGDTLTGTLPLDGAPAGTYRITHGVEGATVPTAPFEVR